MAMEDAQVPPPTVNDLASLLSHAMRRPPGYEIRQRPCKIYLRDRPQWQELLPHLRQLEIDVVLNSDLPWCDESVMDWMAKATNPPSPSELQVILRQPFPERKRSWYTDAMNLMEWSDAMFKGAYSSRKIALPAYRSDNGRVDPHNSGGAGSNPDPDRHRQDQEASSTVKDDSCSRDIHRFGHQPLEQDLVGPVWNQIERRDHPASTSFEPQRGSPTNWLMRWASLIRDCDRSM